MPDRAAGQYVKSEQFCVGEALNWSDDRQIASVHGANALSDFGGAASVVPVRIGDALALYKTLAGNKLEDNLNPVRRIYYAASTMVCVPTSLSQEVGAALGAQAGEAKLREVITAGGFRSVRRATETPFNMILEARL